MPITPERLAADYAIAGVDPTFSTEPRSQWSYALPSRFTGFGKLNPSGPDPADYIQFARAEIKSSAPQAPINAMGHAKRAVHQAVDGLFQLYGLTRSFGSLDFPRKLELLSEIGAFPTTILSWLNERRNLLEHDYSLPDRDEANHAVDVAELFVASAYVFLRDAVVGAYVGHVSGVSCSEVVVDSVLGVISDSDVVTSTSILVGAVTVHVNMSSRAPRNHIRSIPIDKDNRAKWVPILDLLAYCTRRNALRLHCDTKPGDLNITQRQVFYGDDLRVPIERLLPEGA